MILFVTVEGVVEEDDEVEAEVEEGADAMESKLGYHERKAKEQSYKRKFSKSETQASSMGRADPFLLGPWV